MSKVKIFFGAFAIFLVLFILFLIERYPILLFIFIALIEILAAEELSFMFAKKNLKVNRIFLSALLLLITSAIYFFQDFILQNMKYLIFAGIIIFLFIFLPPFLEFRKTKNIPDFSKFNPVIFSLFYLSLYNYILLIFLYKKNVYFLVLFLGVVYFCDIGAYFAGVLFGKRKIAPVISPNKTWEGLLGGIFLSILISLLITKFGNKRNFWEISTFQSIFLSIFLSIFAQAGDFYESAIKRYCQVKDSGKLLPEHGGILDRTDSIFFTSFIFLIFLYYIF